MASRTRLNRYNWLGQKLLTQHKYDDILRLKHCLTSQLKQQQQHTNGAEDEARSRSNLSCSRSDGTEWRRPQRISEYMVYLSSLALVQTSTRLDEVIYSMQQLNFENNNQYFLLLCQCLLYLGNHESVIALCERVIAKEVNSSSNGNCTDQQQSVSTVDAKNPEELLNYSNEQPAEAAAAAAANRHEGSSGATGSLASDDYSPLVDSEFKKLFRRVSENHLIVEPRFWFIFGLCLEYRNRAKDALVAYKVSSNLALGATSTHHGHTRANIASLTSFHECHLKYAHLCVRLRADYKRASQVLSLAVAKFPQNYTLNPLLSLISCSGHNSNLHHFNRAAEMLATLENFSASNRNPSSSYNNLALRCQRRHLRGSSLMQTTIKSDDLALSESSDDDNKFRLHYLLIKIHLQINSMIQDSSNRASLFSKSSSSNSNYQLAQDKKAEQMIDLMRSSEVSCWQSSSLWNNMAVCYLLRGKLIASFTCLIKAQHLDPLDWRISYNLALTCIQVGLVPRALCSLIAAKQLFETSEIIGPRSRLRAKHSYSSMPRIIKSLMAICFDRLNQVDEARRLHIEATRSQVEMVVGKLVSTPILSIVNYLIFLHKSAESDDPQTVKLKLHLLDLVEQFWLQRNQNDSQFNIYLLDVANRIGQKSASHSADGRKTIIRKTYAWSKVDEKMVE